jgi:hypothetical protein
MSQNATYMTIHKVIQDGSMNVDAGILERALQFMHIDRLCRHVCD